MLKKLFKKIMPKQQNNQQQQDSHVPVQFRGNLAETEDKLKELFGNAVDLNIETINFAKKKRTNLLFAFTK